MNTPQLLSSNRFKLQEKEPLDLLHSCCRNNIEPFISPAYQRVTAVATTKVLTGEPLIDMNYEIISEIGKGTFGKVYLARKKASGSQELFAIKKIDMTSLKSSREKKNVSRELRLLKILHHPNIIKIFDIIETKTTTFIIMEHCSKGELHDYITSKGRLSEIEARLFFRQIVSAIDYCHESSIVHRDLKPENLLLKDDSYKTLKLIDFGFGNTWNENGFLNTFCGSPFYAAPEMTQGIEYVGPEVDIWSIGVILFMMLTGELPFQGATISDLYSSIAKGKYSLPPSISVEASSLLTRMLDTHPRRRATLEEIKNHPWTIQGYGYGPTSGVPYRPLKIECLDEETLRELSSLGYSRSEYISEFQNLTKTPIKNLYHLHHEWLQRKKSELKVQLSYENFFALPAASEPSTEKPVQLSPVPPLKKPGFWNKLLGKSNKKVSHPPNSHSSQEPKSTPPSSELSKVTPIV